MFLANKKKYFIFIVILLFGYIVQNVYFQPEIKYEQFETITFYACPALVGIGLETNFLSCVPNITLTAEDTKKLFTHVETINKRKFGWKAPPVLAIASIENSNQEMRLLIEYYSGCFVIFNEKKLFGKIGIHNHKGYYCLKGESKILFEKILEALSKNFEKSSITLADNGTRQL